MAFSHDLPAAARRNIQAANQLNDGHRRDVAGYLFGIAAECAVKHMVARLPITAPHDKDRIFHAHFPELRTLLRDALAGRQGLALMRFINNNSFMNNWAIAMRYAPAKEIKEGWVDSWATQATDVVNAMEA